MYKKKEVLFTVCPFYSLQRKVGEVPSQTETSQLMETKTKSVICATLGGSGEKRHEDPYVFFRAASLHLLSLLGVLSLSLSLSGGKRVVGRFTETPFPGNLLDVPSLFSPALPKRTSSKFGMRSSLRSHKKKKNVFPVITLAVASEARDGGGPLAPSSFYPKTGVLEGEKMEGAL